MKITGQIKNEDQVELPVYINGSYAERIIMSGAELKRLVVLLETYRTPQGTVSQSSDNTPTKPPVSEDTPKVGDDAKEVRKDVDQQVGDDAAESR